MTAVPVEERSPAAGERTPIAGFWRRLAAFGVDGLILGVPALLLGLALFRWAAALGQAGRLIGFVVTLLYFGLLNSRLGGGQTLGKRLLGIRVIDRAGHSLSPVLSIARSLVVAIPWFLNGVFFGADASAAGWPVYVLGALISCVVFGGLGSAAYLFVFNRRTRQLPHDLAVGSFVVRVRVRVPAAAVPTGLVTPRLHLIVVGCWMALTLILPGAGVWVLRQSSLGTSFKPLAELQTALGKQPGVGQVKVTMGSTIFASPTTGTTTTAILRVEAQSDAWYVDLDALVPAIAGAVLDMQPELLGNQLLVVDVKRQFDFGIASWSEDRQEGHDAAAWHARLSQHSAAPDKT